MRDNSTPDEKKYPTVHFSFHKGPEYWERKGTEIAQEVLSKLEQGISLDWPVILPARKMTAAGATFEQLIAAAINNVRNPNDYYVPNDEPVVKGFIKPFDVNSFEDLPESPILGILGLQPDVDLIFEPGQYTEQEKKGLTGGLYLPAVRVLFVPIQPELA